MHASPVVSTQYPPWLGHPDHVTPLSFEVMSRPDGAAIMCIEFVSDPELGDPVFRILEGEIYMVFKERTFWAQGLDEAFAYVSDREITVAEINGSQQIQRFYSVRRP